MYRKAILLILLGSSLVRPVLANCIALEPHAFQLSKAYKWLSINRDNVWQMSRSLPEGKDRIAMDVRQLVDEVRVQLRPVVVLAMLRRDLRSARDIQTLDDDFNYEAAGLREVLSRNAIRLNELAVLESNPAMVSQALSIRDRMQEVDVMLTNCTY